MKNVVDNKLNRIILFITLLISFLLFEIVFYFLGVDFNNLSKENEVMLSIIKYLFFVSLLIIIYRKYLVDKLIDFKKNFKEYFEISFKDWLTGFLIMIVSNIIISSLIGGLGENENAVQTLISNFPFIALIMTTIFAPFIEEMIFRKCLQDCFKKKIFFMIVSGLLFGYVHVMSSTNIYEYLLIIPYGALGFMFAHTLSKTDNIFCTIMMHMLHNGVLTIISMVI